MQENELIYQGRKIFYRTIGEGPVVVLLHGFGEDGNIWKNQFDAFPGYHLIIPDLPGSGRSQMIDDMSMEGMAELVKEMISPYLNLPLTPQPLGGENNTQPLLNQEAYKNNDTPKSEVSALAKSSPVGGGFRWGPFSKSEVTEQMGAGEFYWEADPLTYPLLKNFVAEHRSKPTQAEAFLWKYLRGKQLEGYKFRRQHIIGNFIADFVCLSKRVIIEVDGLIHQLPDNIMSDEARTLWLKSKDYEVIRFTNEEVLFNTEETLNRILQTLEHTVPPPKKIYGPHPMPPLIPPTGENNTRPLLTENADNNKDSSKSKVSVLAKSSPVGGARDGAILIGHSMGGYITLAFVDKYPHMLKGFGLFHSNSFADSEEKRETRKKGIQFIEQHGPFEFLKTAIPNLYGPVTKDQNPSLIEEHIGASHNFSDAALVCYYKSMMARPDRSHLLKQTPLPVIFILGKYDTAVPMEDGLKQCHLPPVSYIHVLEESGHMGMIEETKKTNQILNEYLKAISNPLPS